MHPNPKTRDCHKILFKGICSHKLSWNIGKGLDGTMVDNKRIDKVQLDLKTVAVFYIKNTTAKVDRPIDIWNCSPSSIIISIVNAS